MVELVRAFQRGVSFPPLGVVIWVIGVNPRSAAVHLRKPMDLSSLALSLSGICAAEDDERGKGTRIIHTACGHISELHSCCIPIQAATQRPFAPPPPPTHKQTLHPPQTLKLVMDICRRDHTAQAQLPAPHGLHTSAHHARPRCMSAAHPCSTPQPWNTCPHLQW